MVCLCNLVASLTGENIKLRFLDVHSSEFSVIRNYLDWLTVLPGGFAIKTTLNLAMAW